MQKIFKDIFKVFFLRCRYQLVPVYDFCSNSFSFRFDAHPSTFCGSSSFQRHPEPTRASCKYTALKGDSEPAHGFTFKIWNELFFSEPLPLSYIKRNILTRECLTYVQSLISSNKKAKMIDSYWNLEHTLMVKTSKLES